MDLCKLRDEKKSATSLELYIGMIKPELNLVETPFRELKIDGSVTVRRSKELELFMGINNQNVRGSITWV